MFCIYKAIAGVHKHDLFLLILHVCVCVCVLTVLFDSQILLAKRQQKFGAYTQTG